jgi:hypothetical protein
MRWSLAFASCAAQNCLSPLNEVGHLIGAETSAVKMAEIQ